MANCGEDLSYLNHLYRPPAHSPHPSRNGHTAAILISGEAQTPAFPHGPSAELNRYTQEKARDLNEGSSAEFEPEKKTALPHSRAPSPVQPCLAAACFAAASAFKSKFRFKVV